MSPWLWILVGLAAVILVVVIVAATRPDDFRYSRTGKINAPPSVVFDYINDLHKWQEWSPWAKLDPNCQNTFSDPASGKDAWFKWSGNCKVGQGSMTLLESRPVELVKYRLEFIKPFKCTHTVDFILKPDGANSTLEWLMYGKQTFMGKFMGVFMNCEKMLGKSFDQGFANLNAIVSKPSA